MDNYNWNKWGRGCFFFICTILILIQWFNPRISTKKLLIGSSHSDRWSARWANTFWLSNEFYVGGRHNDSVYKGAKWLEGNVAKGSVVLASKSIFGSIEFFTHMKYENYSLNLYQSVRNLKNELDGRNYSGNEKILFIFPHQKFGRQSRRHQIIYFFFEKDLLNSLITVKPDYLFVGIKENVLRLYLDEAHWAEEVFKNAEVTIYKINANKIMPLDGFRYVTSDVFEKKLETFKTKYPSEYNDLESVLSYFGLNDADLIENSYEDYQREWVKDNIPSGSRIAYSRGTGKCEIIEEGSYQLSKINKDKDLAYFQATIDYLFLHNSQVRNNAFPLLFKELELLEPFRVFPDFFYFWGGWKIYKFKSK